MNMACDNVTANMDNVAVYLCPFCGHTVSWPIFYYASPNRICKCGESAGFVTRMIRIWPRQHYPDDAMSEAR
jgi:hypothetical protein